MDPASNKSGELERRISTRNSVRISISGADDDFDVAGMVSDGFRPSQNDYGAQQPSFSASVSSIALPHAPAAGAGESQEAPETFSNRPSSIAKPHRPHESLSLRHDGGMGPIDESSSSTLTRTSSLSTETNTYVPSVDVPYHGPSGPSHPYGMYTQNVRVARTMSMTTSSTEPVSESSYAGPRGPAHPYGLYTQDTTAQGGIPPVPIPIGFHGLPDRYQRRIGPDGEDIADIIGPDGHTEQLPPYSRYPDEAYVRKVRDLEDPPAPIGGGATIVPVVPPLQTSGLQAIPGAGGIGLATRNPEFESMDDLGSPQSRHSSRSFTSDGSQHEINLAAKGISEKEEPRRPAKSWLKRRLWGVVPVWTILLTLSVMALMGIILGSVVAVFMSKDKRPRKDGTQEPSTSSTATSTFDATPIPTPTDLPPLPTGNFSMPLMTSRVLSSCFVETTLAQAWQCHLVISGLRLSIAKTKQDSLGDYTAAITCNTSRTVQNNVYSYGEQPFLIDKPLPLELVNDTFDTGRGPAWFKMLSYNKTVIIPEGTLSPPGGPPPPPAGKKHRVRRDGPSKYPIGATDFKRKGIISEGAKPWLCTWPETYLEVFIYAQQNSSIASIKPPPPPAPTPAASPMPPMTSGPPSPAQTGWTDPNGITKYPANPGPTNWPDGHPEGKPNEASKDGAPNPTNSAESSLSSGVFGPIDTNDYFTPPPPAYPRVIKVEERHMHGRSKPSCTQVEIRDGQPAKPVMGPDKKPIVIEIEEMAPPPPDTTGELGRRDSQFSERDGPPSPANQCGCVWFLT